MIHKTKINHFGNNGLEINFYIQESITIKDNIPTIKTVQLLNIANLDKKYHKYIVELYGVIMLINYIDDLSQSIQKYHKKLISIDTDKNIPPGAILPQNSYQYYIGVQNLVDNIHRLLLFTIFFQITLDGHKLDINPQYPLQSLKNEISVNENVKYNIFDQIFKNNSNFVDFFAVIEDLNNIYRSQNMFTNTRIFSPKIPAICALTPSDDKEYAYIFHNHSLHQIMLCLDCFVKNYFNFLTN